MDITFKNVGQGDSIILEWEVNRERKIGIIDCNMIGKLNPVLEHLKDNGYREIEFLIISHPHEDHYSGFGEVLDYLEREQIVVKWFAHTISQVGAAYWKFFELGVQATRDLEYILKKGIHLRNIGLLLKWEVPTEKWRIRLADDVFLESLSPSHDEVQAYQRIVKLDAAVHKKQASAAANLLSTVFKITNGDRNVLLTSDAPLETFQRLHKEKSVDGIDFSTVQIAHHGSRANFCDDFWSKLNIQKVQKAAIASAGHNLKYRHPHLDVIQKVSNYKFTVECTNPVHGMKDYIELVRKSMVLDGISEIIEENIQAGDKTFSI